MEIRDKEEFRFGEELLRSKLLTEPQLKTIHDYQRSLGGRVRDIAVRLGFVDEGAMRRFVAERKLLPTVDLAERTIDRELVRRFPRSFLENHQVIPLPDGQGEITLVTGDPSDRRAVEEAAKLTGARVRPALAPRELIRKALREYLERDEAPAPAREPPSASRERAVPGGEASLQALIDVLVRKGVISREELREEVERHVRAPG